MNHGDTIAITMTVLIALKRVKTRDLNELGNPWSIVYIS